MLKCSRCRVACCSRGLFAHADVRDHCRANAVAVPRFAHCAADGNEDARSAMFEESGVHAICLRNGPPVISVLPVLIETVITMEVRTILFCHITHAVHLSVPSSGGLSTA